MENSIKDQVIYTYSNFVKDIKKIEKWLTSLRRGFTPFEAPEWEPDVIISINRGGLVPGVYLSHTLNKPHYPIHYQTRDFQEARRNHSTSKWSFSYKPSAVYQDKNILLVDDINDSGKTFKDILHEWGSVQERVKTVCLIKRTTSTFAVDFSATILDNEKWVVFPWETQHRDGYDKEEEEK